MPLRLDNFTDADGTALTAHTPDVGVAWSISGGTWTIQGNAARGSTGSSLDVAYFDASTPDVDVTMVWSAVPPNTPGLAMRYQDINNYWQIYYASALPGINFQKRVASVETAVANYSPYTPSAGDSLRVVANGNDWKIYVNGVLRISQTNSALASNTKHGLSKYLSSNVWDSYQADLVTPAVSNARITRQSIEAAQFAAFPADNVRLTRQSVEAAQWSPYTLNNVRISRQSVEVAQLIPSLEFPENAARLTQQTVEVLYLEPSGDTTHDQDCFSRMRRL